VKIAKANLGGESKNLKNAQIRLMCHHFCMAGRGAVQAKRGQPKGLISVISVNQKDII
jgi:hypothetical protein